MFFPGTSPADTECGHKMTALSNNTLTLPRLGSVELAVESLLFTCGLSWKSVEDGDVKLLCTAVAADVNKPVFGARARGVTSANVSRDSVSSVQSARSAELTISEFKWADIKKIRDF